MREPFPIEPEPARGLSWPVLSTAVPLLYAWIAWSWWGEVRTQLLALPESDAAPGVNALAALAVAGRIPSVLTEAGLYTLWWKMLRARLPYWRFVSWVATLSALDLLGFSIRRAAEGAASGWHALAIVLAGRGADAASHGMTGAPALASLGLLTLLRVFMTAWAQARGTGRPLLPAVVVTLVTWLVTRLIGWWSVDLLRGMSPVP